MRDPVKFYTLSFVVPALNEEDNIRPTVEQIHKAAAGRFADYEILLINDGSTDKTGSVIEELAACDKRIRVFHNQQNIGLGGAYKRAVAEARLEYLMLVPGDNAHPAEGLIQILSAVGQADIVIPYPLNPQARSRFRRLGSGGFVLLLNALFGLRLRYYNGLVVHQTGLLRQITITTDGFAYQAEALVKLLKKGHSYVEVSTLIDERTGGGSKALRLKNLRSVLKTILHLISEVW